MSEVKGNRMHEPGVGYCVPPDDKYRANKVNQRVAPTSRELDIFHVKHALNGSTALVKNALLKSNPWAQAVNATQDAIQKIFDSGYGCRVERIEPPVPLPTCAQENFGHFLEDATFQFRFNGDMGGRNGSLKGDTRLNLNIVFTLKPEPGFAIRLFPMRFFGKGHEDMVRGECTVFFNEFGKQIREDVRATLTDSLGNIVGNETRETIDPLMSIIHEVDLVGTSPALDARIVEIIDAAVSNDHGGKAHPTCMDYVYESVMKQSASDMMDENKTLMHDFMCTVLHHYAPQIDSNPVRKKSEVSLSGQELRKYFLACRSTFAKQLNAFEKDNRDHALWKWLAPRLDKDPVMKRDGQSFYLNPSNFGKSLFYSSMELPNRKKKTPFRIKKYGYAFCSEDIAGDLRKQIDNLSSRFPPAGWNDALDGPWSHESKSMMAAMFGQIDNCYSDQDPPNACRVVSNLVIGDDLLPLN